jgi:hypothetical protein
VNDEDLLDLFALDLPDLLGPGFPCFSPLTALPSPLAAIEPWPAIPPIAGGAPAWWDDLWDFVGDIWGGAGDLAEKIGRSFSELWDRIWGWIGGAIRWLWDGVVDNVNWLYTQLRTLASWTGGWINDAAGWVRDRVEDAARWVRDRVEDAARWVRDRVEEAARWVRDRVEEAARWVRDRVEDAADWVRDRVWDAAGWLKDRLWEAGEALSRGMWDMGNWLYKQILTPIMGAAESVADRIGDAFEFVGTAFKKAADTVADKLADAIKWPWEHIMEPFLDDLLRKVAIPGKLIRGEYSSLDELIADALDPGPLALAGAAGLILLVLVFMAAFQSTWQSYVSPWFLRREQDMQGLHGTGLLTIGVIQEALNRGFINEARANEHLSRAGYDGGSKQAILELRNIIPGPTDLVRMAVREVFNPQLRQELTLDAEFPAPFAQFAALQGISEEWAGNYWAAHWDLPSPSQGYEMLHRGIINEQQLADLLKALDYAPVWRDKLQAISYNPITRVDLRRLYKMGIINEAQVKDGYRALGYNDERAGWLTEFTKRYYSPDDKSQIDDISDLAQSTIRLGYRRHVLSRDEALDKLVEAGYAEDVADFLLTLDDVQMGIRPDLDADVDVRELTTSIILEAYRDRIWERDRAHTELEALGYLPGTADLLLALEDYKLQRELMDLETTVVKEEYLANGIDRQTAGTRLDALDVLPERRDLLLQRWDLDKAQKPQRLTVAQMQAAFRNGLLTDVQLLAGISARGYNDTDAKLLVDMTDTKPESTARRLSVGQLQRAYKAGLISDAQLLEQLLALEYNEEDAKLLVDMATPAAAAKERQLSAAQLTMGFRAGLVTEAELLQKLTARGYAQADAELLRDIAAQKPEPEPRRLSLAQLKASFKAGLITKSDLLVEVLALGYTDRDAGWLVTLIAPEE